MHLDGIECYVHMLVLNMHEVYACGSHRRGRISTVTVATSYQISNGEALCDLLIMWHPIKV